MDPIDFIGANLDVLKVFHPSHKIDIVNRVDYRFVGIFVGPTSKVLPYLGYLTKRWTEGCNDITQLHSELQALGFDGHYSSVYRMLKRHLQNGEIAVNTVNAPISIPRLSVTEAA